MRKLFLFSTIIYLTTFLAFREDIHHLIDEHSLKCLFNTEKKQTEIWQTCLFHNIIFSQQNFQTLYFFSLKPPLLIQTTPAVLEKTAGYNSSLTIIPQSRGPPLYS